MFGDYFQDGGVLFERILRGCAARTRQLVRLLVGPLQTRRFIAEAQARNLMVTALHNEAAQDRGVSIT